MQTILTINGGSSSIKFAMYEKGGPLRCVMRGILDRMGLSSAKLTFEMVTTKVKGVHEIAARDALSATDEWMDWLEKQEGFDSVIAVGHRVVHGMHRSAPEKVTQELLEELHAIEPYDPDHMRAELNLIEAFGKRHLTLEQFVCFDTAFHHEMPRVARLLPIPRRFDAKGVRRYGFHGLSYAYLMEELQRRAGTAVANGRVVLAHLGNGASMAAVLGGRSIDTTMGFTPASGLMMSTRSGDLDPGVVAFLAHSENMSATQFDHMVNHEAGLLGVSETNSDMRDLLAREKEDIRAAEAVALFCYQAKKTIGAYAAALGGIDALVFAGGIGENAPVIRQRICEGLGFLGIELDAALNTNQAEIISTAGARIPVYVIRTDEELMIARSVARILQKGDAGKFSPVG